MISYVTNDETSHLVQNLSIPVKKLYDPECFWNNFGTLPFHKAAELGREYILM